MDSFLKASDTFKDRFLVIKSLYHLEKNYHYSQMGAVRAVKLIFNTKKRYQNSEMNQFREIIQLVNWILDSKLTGIELD